MKKEKDIKKEGKKIMKKQINIYSRKNDKGYNNYSYVSKDGTFYQVKFVRTIQAPVDEGYFLVVFDTKDTSREITKPNENGFKPNDILWFKNVESITRNVEFEEQRAKELDEMMNEIFG